MSDQRYVWHWQQLLYNLFTCTYWLVTYTGIPSRFSNSTHPANRQIGSNFDVSEVEPSSRMRLRKLMLVLVRKLVVIFTYVHVLILSKWSVIIFRLPCRAKIFQRWESMWQASEPLRFRTTRSTFRVIRFRQPVPNRSSKRTITQNYLNGYFVPNQEVRWDLKAGVNIFDLIVSKHMSQVEA